MSTPISISQLLAAMDDDVQVGRDMVEAKAIKEGTKVTFGLPGNLVTNIVTGNVKLCVIVMDSTKLQDAIDRIKHPEKYIHHCEECGSIIEDHETDKKQAQIQ